METPKREHVEPVLGHHIEECLPVPKIPAGFLVLFECRTRSIGRPRQVELDRAKLELHRAARSGIRFDWHARSHLLNQVQQAIHGPAFVAGGDLQSLTHPDPGEAVRADSVPCRGIHNDDDIGNRIRRRIRRLLQGIALLPDYRIQFAQRESQHRRIGRRDGDFGSRKRCGAGQNRDQS